jgi:hypothetical protein
MDNGVPSTDELMSRNYLNKREITLPADSFITVEQISAEALEKLIKIFNNEHQNAL